MPSRLVQTLVWIVPLLKGAKLARLVGDAASLQILLQREIPDRTHPRPRQAATNQLLLASKLAKHSEHTPSKRLTDEHKLHAEQMDYKPHIYMHGCPLNTHFL